MPQTNFLFNPAARILLFTPHNLNVEVDVWINFEYFLIKKKMLKTSKKLERSREKSPLRVDWQISTTCTCNMHPNILCTVSLPCSLDMQWGCHKPRADVKFCVFPLKLDSLEYKVVLEKNKWKHSFEVMDYFIRALWTCVAVELHINESGWKSVDCREAEKWHVMSNYSNREGRRWALIEN